MIRQKRTISLTLYTAVDKLTAPIVRSASTTAVSKSLTDVSRASGSSHQPVHSHSDPAVTNSHCHTWRSPFINKLCCWKYRLAMPCLHCATIRYRHRIQQ